MLKELPAHVLMRGDVMSPNRAPAQGRDGTTAITHFDPDSGLFYAWDGISEHIDVSHGGGPVIGCVVIDPGIVDQALEPDVNGVPGSLINVFDRHVRR